MYHIDPDPGACALRGVSMEVNAGEIVAVVGPSGSGKSTLLACLAGLDEPDGGFVLINGDRLTRRDERTRTAMRARLIGILLQSGNLFDHLTVEQNVRFALDPEEEVCGQAIGEWVAADERGRSNQRFVVDVTVQNGDDRRRITASGYDIYAVTAPIIVEAVDRICNSSRQNGGAFALGELVDASDYIQTLVRRREVALTMDRKAKVSS